MASYKIVLNIGGNAVSNAERLATVLATANANAQALAASLRSVGVAASSIPKTPVVVRTVGSARPATVGSTGMHRNDPRYTRHPYTRIASFGYGFSLGGFSGRLSSILQPDANGKLFGMDAAALAKGLNVTAIAGNVVGAIGKALFRATKISTLTPIIGAGLPMMAATKMLMSEGFASGVRLISRRHQAQMGLGEAYLQVNENADYLAGSYGLDRSTALSSINVLTGLGVGGSGRRININEATGLTKIGGLISQHAGVSFERVMTNIQQLLVQTVPNIRDIRELLNQAPVLSKYALREMDERGVTGTDVRTYLKDQQALLSVLKRYELDNASNLGMQARGQISLAMQDFWASIAGNNSWGYVGSSASKIIGSASGAINMLLTSLSGNENFQKWVENLSLTFENIANSGDKLVNKIIDITDALAAHFGIDFGNETKSRYNVGVTNTIKNALDKEYTREMLFEKARAAGAFRTTTPEGQKAEFEAIYRQYAQEAEKSKLLRENLTIYGTASNYLDLPMRERAMDAFMGGQLKRGSIIANEKAFADFMQNAKSSYLSPLYIPEGVKKLENGKTAHPNVPFFGASLSTALIASDFQNYLEKTAKIGGLDPSQFKSNAGASGDDLTGFNRDRRSLEIHFHDKLVEWNSEVVTNNPQEVVEYVADNMDQIMSAAIQRALLGATTKMGQRF